jgi:hypothetical protein
VLRFEGVAFDKLEERDVPLKTLNVRVQILDNRIPSLLGLVRELLRPFVQTLFYNVEAANGDTQYGPSITDI